MHCKSFVIAAFALMSLGLLGSCSHRHIDSAADSRLSVVTGETARELPHAVVYRTSVDCDSLVAVNLNAARDAVVSYPAPTDVSAASVPVRLADSYLLDRRGISPSAGFIKMTYSEYSRLKTASSPAELMKMLVPGAEVTTYVLLPETPAEAVADTAAVNRLIRAGFPGCRIIKQPLTMTVK